DKPLRLDVTEVSIFGQRFAARTADGQLYEDHGWGFWLNRLNANLSWDKLTLGARLDSSVYWLRPADRGGLDAATQRNVDRDGASRYHDAIYPAKLWMTYAAPGVEVTAGDAYVQFGRGLVLSMRKLDDLGLDTTVRGAKIALQKDPIGVTLVAGFANPSRVDEATGRSLFLPSALPGDTRGALPVFGSDRIVGADITAGRGLPVVLSTHMARLTRCAPYAYDNGGRIEEGGLSSVFGSCAPNDTTTFLASLPTALGPVINANEVTIAGQSVEIPNLGGFGSLYVGGAVQRRRHEGDPGDPLADGNAVYGTYAGTIGRVSNTLEVKSYRNFYPLAAAVDVTRASAFSNVVYSIPPTAEVITQDSAFGFFNACVNGGRLRTDVRVTDALLLWAQGIHSVSQTELVAGACDRGGTNKSTASAADVTNVVWDGTLGMQYQWDDAKSYFYASVAVRDDTKKNGDPYYREQRVDYTFSKWLGGPWSLEFIGNHRRRFEETLNLHGDGFTPEPWVQGEHYTAVKIAPKWVISQGIEYTSQIGYPSFYANAGILWRFRSESNVRVFFGQQRGGLRCVSGVCRIFPAYEGGRVELTLRF
ncbi:MAG: DUF6029 family protein, partial [Polyangiaceae bacterium]